MQILITLLLLIITSISLVTFKYLLKRPNLVWLITILGVFAAFISVWFWLRILPITTQLFIGSTTLSLHPILSVDSTGWAITIVLFGSTIALMFTGASSEMRQSPFIYWVTYVLFLVMATLGANTGNIYLSILVFGALDVFDTLLRARSELTNGANTAPFMMKNAIQTLGLFLLIIVGLRVGINTDFHELSELSGSNAVLLVIGLLLRIDLFTSPNTANATRNSSVWHNEFGLIRSIAILVFVSRLPNLAMPAPVNVSIFFLLAVFGIYSAWTWVTTKGTDEVFQFYFSGMAALALLNLLMKTQSSAVGLTLIAIIFTRTLNQPSYRDRTYSILVLLVSLLSIGLPFTISSIIWQPDHFQNIFGLFVSCLIHYLLVFGFVRHGFEVVEDTTVAALKSLSLVSAGLILILTVLFGVWGWDGAAVLGVPWIYGPLAFFYAAGFIIIFRFRNVLTVLINVKLPFIGGGLTLLTNYVRSISIWLFELIQLIVDAISSLAEGKGAMLWTFLILLIVLLSIQGGA